MSVVAEPTLFCDLGDGRIMPGDAVVESTEGTLIRVENQPYAPSYPVIAFAKGEGDRIHMHKRCFGYLVDMAIQGVIRGPAEVNAEDENPYITWTTVVDSNTGGSVTGSPVSPWYELV